MFENRLMLATLLAALGSLPIAALSDDDAQRDFDPLPAGVVAAEDVSAVAVFGKFLLIGADETTVDGRNVIQVLSRDGSGQLQLHGDAIKLFTGEETDDGGAEMDIEGIAVDGDTVVVVGSHSAKRSLPKSDKKYESNLKKLRAKAIVAEPNRGRIYQLRLGPDGQLEKKQRISLTARLAGHPVLAAFKPLPSKENGVDIEGVALVDGKLWLGFRGPVLRDNYVPVMVLDFDDPDDAELRYVQVGGRGIRGMAEVADGLLLIGGPVGDGPGSYQLYHWDGNDMVPGQKRGGRALGTVRVLDVIEPPAGGKAEGIAVIEESDAGYRVLIAYDGVTDSTKVLEHRKVPKSGLTNLSSD